MIMKGKIIKYGDNINTDVIIPARHCITLDYNELASHCMEDLDASFIHKVQNGDVIVAGENFGCGSSREMAPIAIKASGISCVIAKSFARIFFRNAINIGLCVIECNKVVRDAKEGDEIEVQFDEGKIIINNKNYGFKKSDGIISSIIKSGGLMNFSKEKMIDNK